LWFAEGITSYLDQFLPVMAGLTSSDALLEDLGEDLSRYRLTPGRHVQSLSESSREAWVKLYKADAYAPDSQVSYYLKGAVVALCLDLHLRQHGSSLVAVLRRLWISHGCSGRGYQEQDLLAAFAAEAEDLLTLLPRWLHELDDPDLDGYLSGVGLQLEPVMATRPWTGFTARVQSGQLLVSRVWRFAPAEQAGLMVGDEIVALDQERLLQPEQLEAALRSDQPQKLLIARCSQLHELELSSAPPAVDFYRLSALGHVSELQQRQQQQWLLQRSAALG
jgi:predicted metalloprotease with PDZ domain